MQRWCPRTGPRGQWERFSFGPQDDLDESSIKPCASCIQLSRGSGRSALSSGCRRGHRVQAATRGAGVKRVAVDIGGTFTDVVWYDEDSKAIGNEKALSSADPLHGLVEALAAGGVLAGEISLFLHATTIVPNLVVERRGARAGLLPSEGF